MKKTWFVYSVGTLTERTAIEAESEDEARRRFENGEGVANQLGVDDVEIVSVKQAEEEA